MYLRDSLPLLLEVFKLHLPDSFILSILDVHVAINYMLYCLHVWVGWLVASLDQLSNGVWVSELVGTNIEAKVNVHS